MKKVKNTKSSGKLKLKQDSAKNRLAKVQSKTESRSKTDAPNLKIIRKGIAPSVDSKAKQKALPLRQAKKDKILSKSSQDDSANLLYAGIAFFVAAVGVLTIEVVKNFF